jgi:4-carboxymuconolactone decarboxylase
MSRLLPVDRERLSAAQAEVYNRIAAGPRGGVRGPHSILLHSPELAARIEQVGTYLRYQCGVPARLRELAILVVGAHFSADYEWYAHAPLAARQGIPASVIAAIGEGRRPDFDAPQDAMIHAFTDELVRTGHVSQRAYDDVHELLGDAGTVDLTGLIGYYTSLAMTLNVFEVATPGDVPIPWHKRSDVSGRPDA